MLLGVFHPSPAAASASCRQTPSFTKAAMAWSFSAGVSAVITMQLAKVTKLPRRATSTVKLARNCLMARRQSCETLSGFAQLAPFTGSYRKLSCKRRWRRLLLLDQDQAGIDSRGSKERSIEPDTALCKCTLPLRAVICAAVRTSRVRRNASSALEDEPFHALKKFCMRHAKVPHTSSSAACARDHLANGFHDQTRLPHPLQ